jgi:hypothetical protein
MTASCAFAATLAMLRGAFGFSALLSGLAATQNPSLLLLIPLSGLYRLFLLRRPQWVWPNVMPPSLRDPNQWAMGLIGFLLASLPYAFFQITFGMPSIIAYYHTKRSLISLNRFLSLLTDPDQGMIIGVPGLFSALAIGVFLLPSKKLIEVGWIALLLITTSSAMSVPALAVTNWNSGCVLMIRYGYWLAMPLLALLLLILENLSRCRARIAVGIFFVLQSMVLVSVTLIPSHGNYLDHNPIALWLLRSAPTWINPNAEIFFERTSGKEVVMDPSTVALLREGVRPVKMLRHWANQEDSGGLCPEGTWLKGSTIRSIDGGWRYLHAPFQCVETTEALDMRAWRFNIRDKQSAHVLGSGWSEADLHGIWSAGTESRITIDLPPRRDAVRLFFHGYYYENQTTIVAVNGIDFGHINLSEAMIDLPVALRGASRLEILLRHPDAHSPLSRGQLSGDARELGFNLQALGVEMRPQN